MLELRNVAHDVAARLRRLPLWALGAGAVVALAFLVGGGVLAYRTYDYVEHDNEFCLSCHLMRDPFEKFGQSAHRGLGCKACHQPTFAARSQMALTQIIENPEELSTHAEVPDERCASCHVEGDPEKWRLVASSAGHRVHLESQDSTLQDLNCVQCHSSGVHQFVAVDETCGQSACHTDTDVQLGSMQDLQIHCAACHSFNAPVAAPAGVEEASGALRPDRDTCLSCHAMRRLVQMPPEDPHEGVCASCHNPHVQAEPAEAAQTCVNAGCHEEPAESSPFHRGISEAALSDCTSCHSAHDFHAQGDNCLSCHQDVFRTAEAPLDPGSALAGVLHPGSGTAASRAALSRAASSGGDGERTVTAVHTRTEPASAGASPHPPSGAAGGLGAAGSFPGAGWLGHPPGLLEALEGSLQSPPQTPSQSPPFLHREHRDINCMECHATQESHGRVTVTSIGDCRSCHHPGSGDPRVETGDCQACHQSAELPAQPAGMLRTIEFSTGAVTRRLPFLHAEHEGVECGDCHGGPPNLSAEAVDCASCHEEHHEVEASCMSCHQTPRDDSHDVQSHTTCSGSGCHQDAPFQDVPRTRQSCLACHQDLVDHRTEDTCVACHPLPSTPVRRQGGP